MMLPPLAGLSDLVLLIVRTPWLCDDAFIALTGEKIVEVK